METQRITLGLELALAPPFRGDLVRSLFRRAEILLRQRAYREALLFIATDEAMERYRDFIDFLFCELLVEWRGPCARYYAGKGPPLRDEPEATARQIGEWDALLVAALHVALGALERRELPAWPRLRAEARELAARMKPPAARARAKAMAKRAVVGGARRPAATPSARDNVLRQLLTDYAMSELIELAERLGVSDAARRSRRELEKILLVAGRAVRNGPHRGTGVPVLRVLKPNRRGRQPILSVARPDLVAEWHPTLNGDATPDDMTAGSAGSAVWLCSVDPTHEWSARVRDRARAGTGCPYCAGTAMTEGTNLASRFPELARQWVVETNGPLPDDLAPSDLRYAWWRCDRGHSWRARVSIRANGGTGCPKCPKRPPTPGHNLAVKHPELAREWHPTKNGALRPEDTNPCGRERVWWQCAKVPGHAFQSTVGNRLHGRNGCPYCSNRKLLPERSLAAVFPAVAAEWRPTRNGAVTAWEVAPKTPKKGW